MQDNAETSHYTINTAVSGKTRDSRIKTLPIFSHFISTRLILIPQNELHAEREMTEDMEDIKRNVTNELLALHGNEFSFQQFYE
jgi:hypothetical protein